jgi:hypothetical protein
MACNPYFSAMRTPQQGGKPELKAIEQRVHEAGNAV